MTELLVSLSVTAVGVGLLLPLLVRARVMDIPNARSSHAIAVPRGGGVAVVAGTVLACGVSWAMGTEIPWPLIAACVVLATVGLVDDVSAIASLPRLMVQLTTTGLMAVWIVTVVSPAGAWPLVFVPVAAIGMAGYVNAFNFMDGINGMSALNGAVTGAWFAGLGHAYSLPGLGAVGLAVAGASLGFLPWNAPSARVFLGDVGSYGMGVLLAGMAVLAWAKDVPLLLCAAPLFIYFADTGWALAKRAYGRRRLTEAHREHVYQRLVDAGWSHLASAAANVAATAAVILVALGAWNTTALAAAGIVVPVVIYLLLPTLASRHSSSRGAPV